MEAGQKAGSLATGGDCESNQVKALIPIASLLHIEAFLSSKFCYEKSIHYRVFWTRSVSSMLSMKPT